MKRAALEKIEHEVKLLQDHYQESLLALQSLDEHKRQTTSRLERASVLSKAFADEHRRWTESVVKLDESSRSLVGDAFISGATIAYLGVFTRKFREQVGNYLGYSCFGFQNARSRI